MEDLKDLCWWAKDKGVGLNGITPQRTPGRGVGVVATRKLKVMDSNLVEALFDSDSRQERLFSQYPLRLSTVLTRFLKIFTGNSTQLFPSMASWL